ncbi:unnamed protein product [Vitrella brassicaformis CCMP3155]|uniref:COPI associated protein n=1 Tax=Vitrella brassicaformis (strain CCMP3155) TaxID=1169540 RepID=A0A0G4FP67_VITBC|nr:unnamed protein product [Vitrella brassicaformis CCMP3155]|eukprot:CEM15623.1 unnamed protein product [Vitrella brassicaformis CCMP3155]
MNAAAVLLQLLSIISSLLLIVYALVLFILSHVHSIGGWVVAIFLILFGVLLFVADLKSFPMFGYVLFIYTSMGRGLFLIFLGCLCLGGWAFSIAVAVILMVTGVLYMIVGSLLLKGCPKPLMQRNEGVIQLESNINFVAD